MRIRSVKPEFWQHRVMAQLPDFTQLLALALLNMCDDHGYFEADVRVIRGNVMPFREDLRSLSGALRELSGAGWAEVRRTAEHGPVGRICAWDKHQRVSHPAASKLKVYFDTCETPEDFRSDSGEAPEEVYREQGKEQGKEQGAGKGGELPPPPIDIRARAVELHQNLTAPDSPPEAWTGEDFWRWAQVARRDLAHLLVEKWPHPRALSTWWSEARAVASVEALQEAFVAYGADEHWQRALPPCPWAGFASQWTKYVPRGAAHGS